MKKLLIELFACLCFTSCIRIEKEDALIVRGCANTNLKEGCTTYIISACDAEGYCINAFNIRAELGSFEIGDTVVIVKKSN